MGNLHKIYKKRAARGKKNIIVANERMNSKSEAKENDVVVSSLPRGGLMDVEESVVDPEPSMLQNLSKQVSDAHFPVGFPPLLSETVSGTKGRPRSSMGDNHMRRRVDKMKEEGLFPIVVTLADLEDEVFSFRRAALKKFNLATLRRVVFVLNVPEDDVGMNVVDEELPATTADANGSDEFPSASVDSHSEQQFDVDVSMVEGIPWKRKFASLDAVLEVASSLATIPNSKDLAMLVLYGSLDPTNLPSKKKVSQALHITKRKYSQFLLDVENLGENGLLHWKELLDRKVRKRKASKLENAVEAKLMEICMMSSSACRSEKRSSNKLEEARSSRRLKAMMAARKLSIRSADLSSSDSDVPMADTNSSLLTSQQNPSIKKINRIPLSSVHHAVRYLPCTKSETYRLYFPSICSKSFFYAYLKKKKWFKTFEIRKSLCDLCAKFFFSHVDTLCMEVEKLVLALEELPAEFCSHFRRYSPVMDAKSVARTFRLLMSKFTSHLFSLPMEQCLNVTCKPHCPNFALGCDCDMRHEEKYCELCWIPFDILIMFEFLIKSYFSPPDSSSSTLNSIPNNSVPNFSSTRSRSTTNEAISYSSSTRSSSSSSLLTLSSPLRFSSELEYLSLVLGMEEDFRAYIGHRWRSKTQRKSFHSYTQSLGQYEAVALIDYKMKIEPVYRDEVQSKYYGKSGLTLLGAVVYYRLDHDVKKFYYYCLGGSDRSQDSELTSFIVATLLTRLSELHIKQVHFFSDGARAFQSMKFMERIHILNAYNSKLNFNGVRIVDWTFTESGEGKSELDGCFAMISWFVREYALEVGQVSTVAHLRACLQQKLKGSTKHFLLELNETQFYKKIFKDHVTFTDNDVLINEEEFGHFVFDSNESFTKYNRWVFGENFVVLQLLTHEKLKSATLYQRKSTGWIHLENPPPPIPKPATPLRPQRSCTSKYAVSSSPSSSQSSSQSTALDPTFYSTLVPSNVITSPTSTSNDALPLYEPPLPDKYSTGSIKFDGVFSCGFAHHYKKRQNKKWPMKEKMYLLDYLKKGNKRPPEIIAEEMKKKFRGPTHMTIENIKQFLQQQKVKKLEEKSKTKRNIKKPKRAVKKKQKN